MSNSDYLMESADESLRLELKTDPRTIQKQALWAGLKPGMRVADLGCGPGKTTVSLNGLVKPGGEVVGVDFSKDRIGYANKHYSGSGIEYVCRDIREPLEDLGRFDFIWLRFVLEYYLSTSFDIVENVTRILKPGGILCLIDLDHNCLSHFKPPPRLEKTFFEMMRALEKTANFDPYAGRKLYSYLYDLGLQDIDVNLEPHHLIFGELKESENFNWSKKVVIAAKKSGCQFREFTGGYDEFFKEFKTFFEDPKRFIYTPVISCRGSKPIK